MKWRLKNCAQWLAWRCGSEAHSNDNYLVTVHVVQSALVGGEGRSALPECGYRSKDMLDEDLAEVVKIPPAGGLLSNMENKSVRGAAASLSSLALPSQALQQADLHFRSTAENRRPDDMIAAGKF